jgi:hypothetical protein
VAAHVDEWSDKEEDNSNRRGRIEAAVQQSDMRDTNSSGDEEDVMP